MDLTRRAILGSTAGALSVGLAGCTGGAGGGSGEATAPTDVPTETATDTSTPTSSATRTAETSAPTVGTRSHPDLGNLLVDADGMTLYMFEKDPNGEGESVCSGSCADAWPPLTVDDADAVSKGDAVSATLGTIERSDGSTQVTAGGWPLYYFASDEDPGDAEGQGANDVWWVLRPDGTVVEPQVQVRTHDEHGDILVDADGMTLYMFEQDTKGEGASACYDDCASAWPPLTVGGDLIEDADVGADLTTFERETGEAQVAAGGWPLYYFASDEDPGDAEGQGANDVWWVLRPDGSPVRSETTTSGSDY